MPKRHDYLVGLDEIDRAMAHALTAMKAMAGEIGDEFFVDAI